MRISRTMLSHLVAIFNPLAIELSRNLEWPLVLCSTEERELCFRWLLRKWAASIPELAKVLPLGNIQTSECS